VVWQKQEAEEKSPQIEGRANGRGRKLPKSSPPRVVALTGTETTMHIEGDPCSGGKEARRRRENKQQTSANIVNKTQWSRDGSSGKGKSSNEKGWRRFEKKREADVSAANKTKNVGDRGTGPGLKERQDKGNGGGGEGNSIRLRDGLETTVGTPPEEKGGEKKGESWEDVPARGSAQWVCAGQSRTERQTSYREVPLHQKKKKKKSGGGKKEKTTIETGFSTGSKGKVLEETMERLSRKPQLLHEYD